MDPGKQMDPIITRGCDMKSAQGGCFSKEQTALPNL